MIDSIVEQYFSTMTQGWVLTADNITTDNHQFDTAVFLFLAFF